MFSFLLNLSCLCSLLNLSLPSLTLMVSSMLLSFTPLLLPLLTLIFILTFADQLYDASDCGLEPDMYAANYHCKTYTKPCKTFLVYRGQESNATLFSISSLFPFNQTEFFTLNNLTNTQATDPLLHRDVLIPINCDCHGNISISPVQYVSSQPTDASSIACNTFQGLTKPITLLSLNNHSSGSSTIGVPVKCSCPDENDTKIGVRYLVTYPVAIGDELASIALEFNVSQESIWKANGLDPNPTIYPQTTLLIPVKHLPFLYRPHPSPPSKSSTDPSSVNLTPVSTDSSSKRKSSHVTAVAAGVASVSVLSMTALGFIYVGRRKTWKQSLKASTIGSSQSLELSPDFLDFLSRLREPLLSYNLEEIKLATNNFSDTLMINSWMYRGSMHGKEVAVEQVSSGEATRAIDILTKINHVNIIKLHGFCFRSRPYLVFEYAGHGCLRDCLSNPILASQFTWKRRTQIALDVAVALHYLHCCTNPCYGHGKINARNVLVTTDWRAKLAGFGSARPPDVQIDLGIQDFDSEKRETWILRSKSHSSSTFDRNQNESSSSKSGRKLVRSNSHCGSAYEGGICQVASPKSDIFAFGRVLLELLSGKELICKKLFQSLVMLKNRNRGPQELKVLEELLDPRIPMAGDYHLGNALCLTFLAKACVVEEPLLRPTMSHVMKTLSRMV